jgi:hypothetical protein
MIEDDVAIVVTDRADAVLECFDDEQPAVVGYDRAVGGVIGFGSCVVALVLDDYDAALRDYVGGGLQGEVRLSVPDRVTVMLIVGFGDVGAP